MNDYFISQLIRELRIEHNYTIQDLANLLNVSKAAVSKWENREDIKTEHLYALAKIFNITITELIDGKLSKEKNADFWKRNYDLDNYNLKEDIGKENTDNIKRFFDKCILIRNRFYELLQKWSNNSLNKSELEEFKYIKKYFTLDNIYYSFKNNSGLRFITSEKDEEKYVKTILEEIKGLDKESYQYEISQLYNFKYEIHSDLICESNNLKAFESMLSFFNQNQKDRMLFANIENLSDDEIENNPFIKIIINSGANCLCKPFSISNYWDIEMLDQIEGEKEEIINTIDTTSFYSNTINYSDPLTDWKIYSYKDYLSFIDKRRTEHLYDLVNLKEEKPMMYYNNLIKREEFKNDKIS